jgi:hypothetical protein
MFGQVSVTEVELEVLWLAIVLKRRKLLHELLIIGCNKAHFLTALSTPRSTLFRSLNK